jgi:mRNA-degrading endonuclease toxin of MazEF toxin-antitoxin module
LAFVAPITSTIRGIKLEVVLDEMLKTRGAILVHQIKCELRAEISLCNEIKQLKTSAFSFMTLANSNPLISKC